MLNIHFLNPLRFWPTLPVWPRLFSFLLFLVSFYVVIRLLEVGWRQRRLKRPQSAEPGSPQALPSIVVGTLENIQQLIFFTFYLFAVMFSPSSFPMPLSFLRAITGLVTP